MIRLRLIAFFSLLTMATSSVWAQNVPSPMSPPRLVNDFAQLFTPAQRQTLEDSLVAYSRTTSTQIVVVTVNDLDGYAVGDYSLALLRKWGVGQKNKNNGVVLLIKPRNNNGAGQVFIATGYGVEGALPDSRTGRIIDQQMIPQLRKGDYYTATVNATTAIRQALQGEYSADQQEETTPWFSIIPIFIFIILMVIIAAKGKHHNNDDNNSSGRGGSGGRRGVWIPPIFMGGFGGGGGFGGSGGSGGGGFGGFGGGSGGGGGAGRSF